MLSPCPPFLDSNNAVAALHSGQQLSISHFTTYYYYSLPHAPPTILQLLNLIVWQKEEEKSGIGCFRFCKSHFLDFHLNMLACKCLLGFQGDTISIMEEMRKMTIMSFWGWTWLEQGRTRYGRSAGPDQGKGERGRSSNKPELPFAKNRFTLYAWATLLNQAKRLSYPLLWIGPSTTPELLCPE